jgi:hypothetical protein
MLLGPLIGTLTLAGGIALGFGLNGNVMLADPKQ